MTWPEAVVEIARAICVTVIVIVLFVWGYYLFFLKVNK